MFKSRFIKLYNIIMEQEAIDTVKSIERSAQHIRFNYDKNEKIENVLNQYTSKLKNIKNDLDDVNTDIMQNANDQNNTSTLNYLVYNYVFRDQDVFNKKSMKQYNRTWLKYKTILDKHLSKEDQYPTFKEILYKIISPLMRSGNQNFIPSIIQFLKNIVNFDLILNETNSILSDNSKENELQKLIFSYITQFKGIYSIGSGQYLLTMHFNNIQFTDEGGCDVTDGVNFFEVKNASRSNFTIHTRKNKEGIYIPEFPEEYSNEKIKKLFYIFFTSPNNFFIKTAEDTMNFLKNSGNYFPQSDKSSGGLLINRKLLPQLQIWTYKN